MALTRDKYQLDITFITDENRALAKTIEETKDLPRELRKAQQEGKGVAEVMKQIEQAGKRAEKIDLSKVTPSQLISRGKQIRDILKQIPESAPQAKKLELEYKAINDRLAEMRSRTRGVTDAFGKDQGGGLLGFLKSGTIQFASFAAAAGIAFATLQRLTSKTSFYQKYGKVIENELGSKSIAQAAIKEVTALADDLNLPAEPLIQSYTKLINRGIRPTTEQLTNLLDLAGSQGKTLDDLVEAQLDAATGEFERLKEFGIRAKSEGDKVTLSFKGQVVQVQKTEEAISSAILAFGDLQGVEGAAASATDNLNAKTEKLVGLFDRFLANIGQGKLGQEIGFVIDLATRLVGSLISVDEAQGKASTGVRDLQSAFNQEISVLTRANLTTENRSKLIKQINERYGDYLPNLLKESSTLGDIKRAQELANREFAKKIVLLAAEERFVEVKAKQIKAGEDQLRLATEYEAALEKAAKAQEKLNKTQNGQLNFSGVNVNENVTIGAAIGAKKRLEENNNLIKDLEKEYALAEESARKLGLDLTSILDSGSTDDAPAGGGSGGKSKEKSPLEVARDQLDELLDQREVALRLAFERDELNESEYAQRRLEMQRGYYLQQLVLFRRFNEQKSTEAQEARVKLEQLQDQLNPSRRVVGPIASGAAPAPVERRGVNAQLDAVNRQADKEADGLQQARNERLIDEDQLALGRLQLKRNLLDQEIQILRTGNEEEIHLAAEKAEQLKSIDQELFDKRIALAEREAALKQQLQQEATAALSEGTEAAIALLGRDEEARKRNAGALKAFQKGQIILAGLNEIQQIRLSTKQKLTQTPLPLHPLVIATGVARGVAAAVQTGVAVGKVDATKFARGGTPKLGVFGGRPHSQGGTRGYFDDGTQIEVERDETFAIVNKNARGLLSFLSGANHATGGVPFFADGGIARNAPASIPRLSPGALAQTPAPRQDNTELVAELRAMRQEFSRFPRELKAYVPLTDINKAQYDLDNIEGAAEV